MTNNATLYLLVEGEPYLSAVQDWRKRFAEARLAAWDFVKKLGATSYMEGFDKEIVGLTPVDPIPDGWRLMKPKTKRGRTSIVPAKGPKGDAVRAAIAALPKFPTWQEIAELIGHPLEVRYTTSDGDCGFDTCGVGSWVLVQIGWAGNDTVIVAEDPQPTIDAIMERHPDATIERGHWKPPTGLRPITKARWELLQAQHRVAEEEAAA